MGCRSQRSSGRRHRCHYRVGGATQGRGTRYRRRARIPSSCVRRRVPDDQLARAVGLRFDRDPGAQRRHRRFAFGQKARGPGVADCRSSSDSTDRPLNKLWLRSEREGPLRNVKSPAGASVPMGVNDPERSFALSESQIRRTPTRSRRYAMPFAPRSISAAARHLPRAARLSARLPSVLRGGNLPGHDEADEICARTEVVDPVAALVQVAWDDAWRVVAHWCGPLRTRPA